MFTEVSTLSGPTMGTQFSARFRAMAGIDLASLREALQGAVNRIDQQMSPWIETSVISEINRSDIGDWVSLPKETQEVLATAIEIEAQSSGAFSIAVGEHVNHWGFGPKKKPGLVAPSPVPSGQGCFEMEANRFRRLKPVQIDLCGIAKGYGVDQLARVLQRFGITDYLVSIDGELRCAGSPGNNEGWHVGLEAPLIGVREIAHTLDCHDLSLATSGGYRHFKPEGDTTATHTICPRSGRPLPDVEISVTVASRDCCRADGWATAFMVMGIDKAMETAGKLGLHVLFMDNLSGRPNAMGKGIFTEFQNE